MKFSFKNSFKKKDKKNLVVLGISALVFFQLFQIYKFSHQLEFVDDLEERNSDVLQELDQAKDYLSGFGGDLNEIREFLLLPTSEYDFSDLGTVIEEEEEDISVLLFSFVEQLGEYESNKARYEANLAALTGYFSDPVWVDSQLYILNPEGQFGDEAVSFSMADTLSGDPVMLRVSLGYNGKFSVEMYNAELILSDSESFEALKQDLEAFMQNELKGMRGRVAEVNQKRAWLEGFLFPNADFQAVLKEKSLSLAEEQEEQDRYFYDFRNKDLNTVAVLELSKESGELSLNVTEPVGDSETEFLLSLDEMGAAKIVVILSEGVDARTQVERLVLERKAVIENLMTDRAFKATLEALGLRFGEEVEDEVRISYPVLNSEGETLRVIYIDKTLGDIKVELPDGEQAQSLASALETLHFSGKKKLWTCPRLYLSTLV